LEMEFSDSSGTDLRWINSSIPNINKICTTIQALARSTYIHTYIHTYYVHTGPIHPSTVGPWFTTVWYMPIWISAGFENFLVLCFPQILDNSIPFSYYQARSLRSATGHVFRATPHFGIHCMRSFSMQYTIHYSGLLCTLILCLKIVYKFVL
jgi:hypothetical protein